MFCLPLRYVPLSYNFLFAMMALGFNGFIGRADQKPISLAGQWTLALDRDDRGWAERWYEKPLPQSVRLPGSLPAQGIGDEITLETKWTGSIIDRSFFSAPEYAKYRTPGHIKVPFWLQPEKYYVGAAWYRREFVIPKNWKGRRTVLFLERPHWETRLWLDGKAVGTNLSLSTPHEYDLGALEPGDHSLAIRVDNRLVIDVGRDSHSISDHTQGNWNGIVGRIELQATPGAWIDDLQIFAQVRSGLVHVRGRIRALGEEPGQGTLTLAVQQRSGQAHPVQTSGMFINMPVSWQDHKGSFDGEISIPNVKAWDEFHPNLYELQATLRISQNESQTHNVVFGFRDFNTQGTQFTINGHLTFLRGTLECCIFPKTGHPPTDIDAWRRIIRIAKSHGLNNLRFHSWCPPEAAFDAADELGMYLHVECSSWANASTTLGDGKPVDRWIYEEADRILHSYGNHPSFVLMLYGNEPGGNHHQEFLSRWVAHYKSQDPRRLYTSAAGWPQLEENQFHITPDPRIQAWGAGLKSRINAAPPETVTDYRDYIAARRVPVISHEIGQWCVYPNFEEMKNYTGYLKPRNFEIFQDTLMAHGMSDLSKRFLLASGKLQTLCYKEDIESALRTPGMGGFQLLDLHDFPGQGSALVGVLDPFWNEKGYITSAQYRRFAGPIVPLARLSKRVFTQDERTTIPVDIANFGAVSLSNVCGLFKLVDEKGSVSLAGQGENRNVSLGNGQSLMNIELEFSKVPSPAHCKLVVGVAQVLGGKGLLAENDWDIWVYPRHFADQIPADVTIVHDLNDQVIAKLRAGGKVLWLLAPDAVAPDPKLGDVQLGFSSIFWNTAWTHRQAPHTLGILCEPKHPLLAFFPTEFHSNWQWWYLMHQAAPMILDELPKGIRPVVQVIDDWFTARKLGLVFEAKVGEGKLLVCSIDLDNRLESNPVARQFRASLLRYVGGDHFQPQIRVGVEELRHLRAGRGSSKDGGKSDE